MKGKISDLLLDLGFDNFVSYKHLHKMIYILNRVVKWELFLGALVQEVQAHRLL